jgi:hypothetical protein
MIGAEHLLMISRNRSRRHGHWHVQIAHVVDTAVIVVNETMSITYDTGWSLRAHVTTARHIVEGSSKRPTTHGTG